MNIKYPKTEIMIVLGSKVYPLYTSFSVDDVHDYMRIAHREDFLIFPTAINKEHGNGLWYPRCGSDPIWTDWEVKKNAIKSIIKLPKPKVKMDYNTDSNDYEF